MESTIEANKPSSKRREKMCHATLFSRLQSIMDAKKSCCADPKKVHAIKGLWKNLSQEVPAGILQKHPKVTVICDEASCSIINKIRVERASSGQREAPLHFKES